METLISRVALSTAMGWLVENDRRARSVRVAARTDLVKSLDVSLPSP